MTNETSQPLTDEQLNEYEALHAAATPGPWHLTDADTIVAPLTADTIADVWEPTGTSRNGEFIETARTAVPALLAEVRRLQQQRRYLIGQLAKKDAASGEGDKALREFLSGEPEAETDIAAADNPTPLRWGLNDVLYGDDDTTTVLLSGPEGEPYWLELDPERAAVLRQDLVGPPAEESVTAAPTRTLTESEYNRAWHAVEGAAGEEGADPGTVLHAVLDRLGISLPPAPPIHGCPPDGSGVTPCCGRTPFELPRTDRMSTDPALITCTRPAV